MTDILDEIQSVQREAELLFSAQAVQDATSTLADTISNTLSDSNPLVLSVMTGGLVFTGWLLPRLHFPLQLDYVHATRYRGDTRGHELEWRVRPSLPVQGRTVLLVDDIYDKGTTLTRITDDCRSQGAVRVYTAVLIVKQQAGRILQPDFVGLVAPDRYLFGCGLDYKNYLRNLPAVYSVRECSESGAHQHG
jgi:hypoxanthine phosphoribosyltransferase